MIEASTFNKVSKSLLILFFFIPTLSILGPFFPDLIISITVLFSLFVSFYKKDNKLRKLIKKDFFLIIFFIFFLYLILNSFINFLNNSLFSIEEFKSYFSRSLFLFRFIIYPISIIFLIKKFNLIIKKEYLLIIIITFSFVILDLIFQYYNGTDIFGFSAHERGLKTSVRLSGPFGDELIPGSFLMRYLFIMLLFLYFIINKNYLSFAIIFTITITLVTILMTGERSALILATFGVLIFFLLYKDLRLKISLAILSVILISSLLLITNAPLKKRIVDHTLFQTGISNSWGANSYMEYLNLTESKLIDSHYGAHWETGYRIWKDNKLIGIGLKQFRKKCADKKYDDIKSALKSIRCATHPHHTYIEILSETGLVGLLIFLTLIYGLFKKILTIKKYEKFIKLPMISIIIIFSPLTPTGSFFTNMTLIHFSFVLTIIFMLEKRFFNSFK